MGANIDKNPYSEIISNDKNRIARWEAENKDIETQIAQKKSFLKKIAAKIELFKDQCGCDYKFQMDYAQKGIFSSLMNQFYGAKFGITSLNNQYLSNCSSIFNTTLDIGEYTNEAVMYRNITHSINGNFSTNT